MLHTPEHTYNEPIAIMLIDDDEDCRMLIRDAIDQCHLNNVVLETSGGTEALELLARAGLDGQTPMPGLIYLDIEMPDMDGQTVLRHIRSMPRLADVPVVMMTGLEDDLQKRQAAANGANSYTVKPTDPAGFLQTVLNATNYWVTIHRRPETANV